MIFAPGFFTNAPVQTALAFGAGAAVLSALIGVFTILRGQSFAGHALADLSSAGGAAALLLGLSPLTGFLGLALLCAGILEAIGVQRAAERELATGILLGAGLGVTALLLYLDVTTTHASGAAITIMFGAIFAIPAGLLPLCLGFALAALIALGLIGRPLLLASLAPELAALRGVPVRALGLAHLAILALAVTLSAMTIGAILSTALLIGPAAAALRLASRPGTALALAAAFALVAIWGGILLAYDSYDFTPGHAWPVSFCTVAIIIVIYGGTFVAPKKAVLF
jgi:zinc/manganese transport system permease protein